MQLVLIYLNESDRDEKGIRLKSGTVPVAVSSEKSFFTTMPLFR